MSDCYIEHDFVYIARSSENDEYTNSFLEYYVCENCGETTEFIYEAGKAWKL